MVTWKTFKVSYDKQRNKKTCTQNTADNKI